MFKKLFEFDDDESKIMAMIIGMFTIVIFLLFIGVLYKERQEIYMYEKGFKKVEVINNGKKTISWEK